MLRSDLNDHFDLFSLEGFSHTCAILISINNPFLSLCASQKQNNRKEKDKDREERPTVVVHDKQQDIAANEKKDSKMEEVQILDENHDSLEVRCESCKLGHMHQKFILQLCRSNGIGSISSVRKGMAEKRSSSVMDDSPSACSTD
ncbi:hypothetical protein JHK87_055958 [Glycine soja]|nr:hypothetical protein JHK87_055958 [Glycine soja]